MRNEWVKGSHAAALCPVAQWGLSTLCNMLPWVQLHTSQFTTLCTMTTPHWSTDLWGISCTTDASIGFVRVSFQCCGKICSCLQFTQSHSWWAALTCVAFSPGKQKNICNFRSIQKRGWKILCSMELGWFCTWSHIIWGEQHQTRVILEHCKLTRRPFWSISLLVPYPCARTNLQTKY